MKIYSLLPFSPVSTLRDLQSQCDSNRFSKYVYFHPGLVIITAHNKFYLFQSFQMGIACIPVSDEIIQQMPFEVRTQTYCEQQCVGGILGY